MPNATGLQRTIALLSRTMNPAANGALHAAMSSEVSSIRVEAGVALTRRQDAEAHFALLRGLAGGAADLRDAVTTPEAANRLRRHVIQAIHGEDVSLCKRACRYAIDSDDVQVLAELATAAQNVDHPYALGLATAVMRLARTLAELLDRHRRNPLELASDPAFTRRSALMALGPALDKFDQHGRIELIEAFLMLASPDDPRIRSVMQDSAHPCHSPIVESLTMSPSYGAIDIVIHALLTGETGPLAQIAAERVDRPFVSRLLDEAGDPPALRVLAAVRQYNGFRWLESPTSEQIEDLSEAQQATAIKLAAATQADRQTIVDLAEKLLKNGHPRSRRAACAVVAEIRSEPADRLLDQAVEDNDPKVAAIAVRQLRNRRLPQAEVRLIALLDHSELEVRTAAQQELTALNYRAYNAIYDSLEEAAQRALGRLVAKADPTARDDLAQELDAPSVDRRLRAIDIICAMGIADDLMSYLQKNAADSDAGVRAEAARALGEGTADDALTTLSALLDDPNAGVRSAARQSLSSREDLALEQSLLESLRAELAP